MAIIAPAALIGVQAVAVGIDPDEQVAAALDACWRGVSAG
jgi:hypothetical protein